MNKVQFGESLTADFKENTWTFEIEKDLKVLAGNFAIVPVEQYDAMVKLCRRFSSGLSIECKTREEQELYREICQNSSLSSEVIRVGESKD
jgi:hypothetical protein